jgi:hypothetical protein
MNEKVKEEVKTILNIAKENKLSISDAIVRYISNMSDISNITISTLRRSAQLGMAVKTYETDDLDYLNYNLTKEAASKGFHWIEGTRVPIDAVVKWLRETHKLHIEIFLVAVDCNGNNFPQPFYKYNVSCTTDGRYLLDNDNDGDNVDYKKTLEVAITYCLTKINNDGTSNIEVPNEN